MSKTIVSSLALIALAAFCAGQVEARGDGDAHVTAQKGQTALDGYAGSMTFRAVAGDLSQRVDLDINIEPVHEALKAVLSRANIIDVGAEDVPRDVRVTLAARNVRLRTALNLIAEAAGIGWRKELDGGKVRYRFGKSIRSWDLAAPLPEVAMPAIRALRDLDIKFEPFKEGVIWRAFTGTEERSTVTCPHCHAQITRVGPRENPKCPKCSTEFKPGWKVCPFDGTKRPDTRDDWKYCPVCGKALSGKAGEKSP